MGSLGTLDACVAHCLVVIPVWLIDTDACLRYNCCACYSMCDKIRQQLTLNLTICEQEEAQSLGQHQGHRCSGQRTPQTPCDQSLQSEDYEQKGRQWKGEIFWKSKFEGDTVGSPG